jgi:pectate lyase
MIGNRYREGPALKTAGRYAIGIDEEFPNEQIYVSDNVDTRYRTNSSQAEWDIVGTGNFPPEQILASYWRVNAPVRHQRLTPWPSATIPIIIKPSSVVVESVLAEAGATRPVRDARDAKLVADYRAGTGSIRLSSSQRMSDWPVLKSASAELDSDGDGMPDAWEVQYGLNPQNGADGVMDMDNDGYTNLEEYLNLTNPMRPDR